MNLLLLSCDEVARGTTITLEGRRARHLETVLRARPGSVVRCGVERSVRGEATVLTLGEGTATLELRLEASPPELPGIDLLLAMPRPKALPRALQAAASLGVRRIDLVNAWRVEKAYFESPRLAEAEVIEELRLGCEQGGHTWVPELQVHRLLMPYLTEVLGPRLRSEGRQGLLAHPRDAQPLEEVLGLGPVTLAIGPEGGWIDRELTSFEELGVQRVSLTRGVLRSDFAVVAGLAQLELLRRRRT